MSEDLQEAMMVFMVTLCDSINTLDTSATELVRSADLLDDLLVSNAMREVARRQRVKILELHGQIAVLNATFTKLFGTKA